VAQLLCVDGLDLEAALAQADAEKQAQEEQEAANWKESYTSMAVGRIKIHLPEFDDADVRAALHECCDDENAAEDLLLGGYRAPRSAPQPTQEPRGHEPASQLVERDQFPSLLTNLTAATNMHSSLPSKTMNSWTSAATQRRRQVLPSGSDAFPALPEPSRQPAVRQGVGPSRLLRQPCPRKQQAPRMIRRR
jgi:hypothetical protein